MCNEFNLRIDFGQWWDAQGRAEPLARGHTSARVGVCGLPRGEHPVLAKRQARCLRQHWQRTGSQTLFGSWKGLT